MSKIVFKHQQAGLGSLSLAGNFTKWEIKPMVFNGDEAQWEFEIEPEMLENCELQDGKAVTFFKFVDDQEAEPSTPDPTPVVQMKTPRANEREESPVMITESDLEEDFHDTNNQDQGELTETRNHSADTSVSATQNPAEYKNFLQSIVFFFKNLFRRWFGMGTKQQESR